MAEFSPFVQQAQQRGRSEFSHRRSPSTQTCLAGLKMKQGLELLLTQFFLSFHRRGNPKRKWKANFVTPCDRNLTSKRARYIYNVGSINDSRINVKKCASRNGLKLRSANTARSMPRNTAVQDRGRRLNQSHFRSMAEVSFLPSANTRKRASASREILWESLRYICYFAIRIVLQLW